MKIKSLVQTILPLMWAQFGTQIREALLAIDAEDFVPVAKKLKEELKKQGKLVSDSYLERGFLALKQYYAIAVIDMINMHAVSDAIDPFWHMHILFTKNYSELSDKMFGHYMHHDPLDHDNEEKVDFVQKLYTYTIECYKEVFTEYDKGFMPPTMKRKQLICVHFGTSRYPEGQESIFLLNKELATQYRKYNYAVA